MAVAGNNEKKFELFFNSFFPNAVQGKRVFNDDKYCVSISVDNHFTFNDYEILIEVDASNMAKLVSGQYVLLSNLYDRDLSKAIFLVIHYYNNYNPQRTINNFRYLNNKVLAKNGIKYCVFSEESFKAFCEECPTVEILVNNLLAEARVGKR